MTVILQGRVKPSKIYSKIKTTLNHLLPSAHNPTSPETPPDIQQVLLSEVPHSATIPRLCFLIRATPEGNIALSLPVLALQTHTHIPSAHTSYNHTPICTWQRLFSDLVLTSVLGGLITRVQLQDRVLKFSSNTDLPLQVVSEAQYWPAEPVWMDKPSVNIEGVSVWQTDNNMNPSLN